MFNIAFIQFEPVFEDLGANISKLGALLDASAHADLVVMPELASTGYNFRSRESAFGLAEHPAQSAFLDMLSRKAAANKQYIVSGFSEKAPEGLYNSSALIGPQGLEGVYRKMHLFMNEKDIFLPGDKAPEVYDTGFCRLGMQICFDYLFPEPWRMLAERGADMIVHPSNLLTMNATKALPGIALMNKVYIATSNRIGTEGDLTFNGGSMLLDPSGNILHQCSSDEEELLSLQVDPAPARDKMITARNHVFDDRRPEQYQ